MKKKMVTALLAVSMLAGLSAVNVMAADDDTITVGFSQVAAESDLAYCKHRVHEIYFLRRKRI